ncbi:MAG: HAD-IIB family hydrolase [Myxococcales bacterium]|nr:HAD-IIB family hydrolase [Myxococcales bacterium]
MALAALSQLPDDLCKGLSGVFVDIDDTLTWKGELVPEAFAALHALREASIAVVPVTGRPGGWVDHVARTWPVAGVVGENGGLWFAMQGDRMVRRFAQSAEERSRNRERLTELAPLILQRVPGSALASDQSYRDLDLAIDFCEDVPRLDEAAVQQIVELFHHAGARCKVSSIHVNGWYGDFDKLTGCRRFAAEILGDDLDAMREHWLYVGDSPNDEPLFDYFPVSVGVANVAAFLDRMTHHPSHITLSPGGHGFAELAAHVLGRRSA